MRASTKGRTTRDRVVIRSRMVRSEISLASAPSRFGQVCPHYGLEFLFRGSRSPIPLKAVHRLQGHVVTDAIDAG